MPPDDSQTVLLTSDLGSVGDYGPTARLTRVIDKGSLHTGHLFLRATLDEMIKIRHLSRNLDENHRELLEDARVRYDTLMRREKELELLEERNWIFKLFKFASIKRAKQEFVDNTIGLWGSTTTTSDRLKRTLLSTPTTNLAAVEGESVATNEPISGVAIEVDGPITQEAIAIVQGAASILATSGDPFADPTPTDGQDGQTSTATTALEAEALSSARSSTSTSPSSPGSASSFSYYNFNLNYNIVNSTDANTQGFTINNSGSRNSGSVTSPRSSVNSPPS